MFEKKYVMIHGTRNLAHPLQNGIADIRVNLVHSVLFKHLVVFYFYNIELSPSNIDANIIICQIYTKLCVHSH